jgi:hypothetical protein
MSFGFGVGDFVTVSSLTIALYKAFKNAPVEFVEISHQLQSLHIVIAELKEQAEQDQSPLNQNGARRQRELFEIRDNLLETMKELQDLHKRFERMGRISWSRFQLGQENLAAIRGKLTVQISALNAFMGSLTLGALGRMEPILQRIHQLLDERARGSIAAAQSVLSAMSDRQEDWQRLEMELRMEGIPLEYVRDNREQIKAVLSSVVESNHLEGYDSGIESEQTTGAGASDNDSVLADDSVSQVQGRPQNESRIQNRVLPTEAPDLQRKELRNRTPKQPIIASKSSPTKSESRQLSTSKWLKTLTPDEEAARILLMNHGFDVRNFKPLKASRLNAMFGNPAKIQAEAVCWAAARGNDVALGLLLDRGCDPSSREKHPPGPGAKKRGALYRAIECEQWNCVWLLLDRGGDVHEAGVLNLAVRSNQLALVEAIVRKGVSVDKLDEPGDERTYSSSWAPLHHAARFGALEMVELLLRLGAKVDIGVPCGTIHPQKSASISLMIPSEIVLTYCEEDISLQVLRLLVDGGASINHMDKYGWTALHIAVHRGFRTVATLLLDRGADVNAQLLVKGVLRHLSDTPLHEAIGINNFHMMELLLGRGANVKAIGSSGLSTLKLVESLNSDSRIQFLFSKYY